MFLLETLYFRSLANFIDEYCLLTNWGSQPVAKNSENIIETYSYIEMLSDWKDNYYSHDNSLEKLKELPPNTSKPQHREFGL